MLLAIPKSVLKIERRNLSLRGESLKARGALSKHIRGLMTSVLFTLHKSNRVIRTFTITGKEQDMNAVCKESKLIRSSGGKES